MSIQEKVLMRKIKQREKQKLKLLQQKNKEAKQSVHEEDEVDESTFSHLSQGVKRIQTNEAEPVPKKKKKYLDFEKNGSDSNAHCNIMGSIEEAESVEKKEEPHEQRRKKKKNKKKDLDLENNEHNINSHSDVVASTDQPEPDDNKEESHEPHKKKKKNKKKDPDLENNEHDINSQSDVVAATEEAESDEKKEEPRQKKKKNKKKDLDLENNEHNINSQSDVVAATEEAESDEKKEEPRLPGADSTLEILSNVNFDTLKGKVCEKTLKAIAEMGYTKMTEIQAKSIPLLLEGRHLVGSAKTGSGKTLAFLIPTIDLIYKMEFKPRNGTGAIIISPTRELAMQTFGVLSELMKYHHHTYALLIGGTNRASEAQKLWKGSNILVTTPGRLLDHMQNTSGFVYKNLICLVMDEADRILDVGFEEDMKQIINLLPQRRQTVLFSATRSEKTEALTSLAFASKEPTYVGVDDLKSEATVSGLRQGYVILPSESRLMNLFTFLKKKRKKKVMVFFSTCLSVKYHSELFNYIDLPVMCIHGQLKQNQRTSTYFKFCKAASGTLLCTDVAARGWDIPAVDWIIQYDPPDDPKEYIHRVGRTARGEGSIGRALLFLRPEELKFRAYLNHAKIPLNEFELTFVIPNIQEALQNVIAKNYYLLPSAKEAFKSYVRAYNAHRLKTVFDINKLDLTKVALSFGLKTLPAVDLDIGIKKSRAKRKSGAGFGHQKNMNHQPSTDFKKTTVYRQPKRNGSGPDARQWTR